MRKSTKYVCDGCRRRATGRPGLVACPDCGSALREVTFKGQRPRRG